MKRPEDMEFIELRKHIFSKPFDSYSTKYLKRVARQVWIYGEMYANDTLFQMVRTEIGYRHARNSNIISTIVAIAAVVVSVIALFKSSC